MTVFLSHSGSDTERADVLRQRLEAAGIRVWFDKENLKPGTEGWQRQLERAIEEEVSAFVVYVGARGIVNWVRREVDLAVSRATRSGAPFPVVPVISDRATGSGHLPGFISQFQAVRDVEGDPKAWAQLLGALNGNGGAAVEPEPFFNLEAITAERGHLFFGRKQETETAGDRLWKHGIVLIAGASGSGKSSLARAGLVSDWKGGEIALRHQVDPRTIDWHVVVTRPGTAPRDMLARSIDDAAKALGRSEAAITEYRRLAREGDPEDVRRALLSGLDWERTRTLLIVDQFEELVHPIVGQKNRKDFASLIAALADPDDPSVCVALTMRDDYTNRLKDEELAPLAARLDSADRAPRYVLPPMTGAGLRASIQDPLALAGRSLKEATALANAVLADVGLRSEKTADLQSTLARPGDLALVQFAVSLAWDDRGGHDDDLLRAYAESGRVEGALANAAERVFRNACEKGAEAAMLEAALLRLGGHANAGLVRREAHEREFSDEGWAFLQRMAEKRHHRLVQIRGVGPDAVVEISHEALLTQWPLLNDLLLTDTEAKRSLDALAERVADAGPSPAPDAVVRGPVRRALQSIGVVPVTQPRILLQGWELARFADLRDSQPGWLTPDERSAIEASERYASQTAAREARVRGIFAGASLLLLGLLVLVGILLSASQNAARRAQDNLATAVLTIADVALLRGEHRRSARLSLAAQTLGNQGEAMPIPIANLAAYTSGETSARELRRLEGHGGTVWSAAFSPDGRWIATGSEDGAARVWDAASGAELRRLEGHGDWVNSAAFSPDGRWIVTGSGDRTARVWDAANGAELSRLEGHGRPVFSPAFSPNGRWIITGSSDDTARVWDAVSGAELRRLEGDGGWVNSAGFSPDGRWIVTGSDDGTARVWDATLPDPTDAIGFACDQLGGEDDLGDLSAELDIPLQPICTEEQRSWTLRPRDLD